MYLATGGCGCPGWGFVMPCLDGKGILDFVASLVIVKGGIVRLWSRLVDVEVEMKLGFGVAG
jgi:hypothetical protein